MKQSHDIAFIVEMLFHQNKPVFALRVEQVETLFDVHLRDDTDYIRLHCLLRMLKVEFLYMEKSNTCGFMRLYDINKWEYADVSALPQKEVIDTGN